MLYKIRFEIILANYLKEASKPAKKPVWFFKNIMGNFSKDVLVLCVKAPFTQAFCKKLASPKKYS